MDNKNNLESRLKKYAALAGGISAAITSAGQIVYTDLNPDSVISGNQSFALIDFDGDGSTDFTLSTLETSLTGAIPSLGNLLSSFNYAAVIGTVGSGSNEGWAATNIEHAEISDITPGVAINGDGVFGTGKGQLGFFGSTYFGSPYNTTYGTYSNGNFLNKDTAYIGVKFDVAGAAHYGWIRVGLSPDGKILTVRDYAYNTVPGRSIYAGERVFAAQVVEVLTISSFGAASGSLIATPIGGSGDCTYLWTDGFGNTIGTAPSITGLIAGKYMVVITDIIGNKCSADFTITQPSK